MKIKVSSSFSGVIPTGSYENTRPSYSAEVEFEIKNTDEVNEIIDATQKELQAVCLRNFKLDEQRHLVERITKERADFRFYPAGDEQFVSVTSILNWDSDFFVTPEQLQQYASQGNLYDLQVRHYMNTGEWLPPEEIEGSWTDLVIVKKGDLNLTVNQWNFPAFLEKYPLENMEEGTPVYSYKHKFAGTPDIRKCIYKGKKTLADVKRTPDPLKHFKQTAAYIIAEEENGEEPYEQMLLIPANDKTKQGYSKPIITEEIGQYKEMFLKERESFKKRFGI